jgi:hypothetical protein
MKASTRRITRVQREEAASAAAGADLRPFVHGGLVVLGVLLLTVVVSVAVPGASSLGGPLQDPRVASTASMTFFRKASAPVSLPVFVPWNASGSGVVLDEIEPLEPEGVEIVRAGLLPAGVDAVEPTRGFPPPGLSLGRVGGSYVPAATGPDGAFQIVVGLRGSGTVQGFVLRYHVGDAGYAAILMQGATLCDGGCGDRTAVEDRQRALASRLASFVVGPAR